MTEREREIAEVLRAVPWVSERDASGTAYRDEPDYASMARAVVERVVVPLEHSNQGLLNVQRIDVALVQRLDARLARLVEALGGLHGLVESTALGWSGGLCPTTPVRR